MAGQAQQPGGSAVNALPISEPSNRTFLSLNEAAKEIDCSRRFLEMRIEDGELKVFRPSKRLVRIQRSELERWVESYSSKTGAAS